jgi:outer membrane protein assembly factor BamB
VWTRNTLREFGGRQISWLISEAPLVDGGNVIVTPGGPRATIVALDKMTGKTVWTSQQLSDEAGYASLIAADVGGVRVYMTLTARAGVGVRASDGRLMWRFQPVANDTANIATPIFDDNKVFSSTGYGTGAALLALTANNGEVAARAGLLHARYAESPRRARAGERLSLRILVRSRVPRFRDGTSCGATAASAKGTLTAEATSYVLSEDNVVNLVAASQSGIRRGRFSIQTRVCQAEFTRW